MADPHSAAGKLTRCRVIPLPDHQLAVEIDGRERLRWHHGPSYPRPFFFPLRGPSGQPLTRIGHPGAPNHDHHLSIWFAHQNVAGCNFWENRPDTQIRQKQWLCYHDADEAAVLAVALEWFADHDPRPLLEQELVAAVMPGDGAETLLEIQATFRPVAGRLEFGQTNFGFLGVRVAKEISAHFGGGVLTDSEGRQGEPAVFGQTARWVDYSGTSGTPGHGQVEGITYHDHPGNPDHPAHWHVRADGWMIASTCMNTPRLTTRDAPLVVRYLLHAHGGPVARARADGIGRQFAAWKPWRVVPSRQPHTAFEVQRVS